MRAQVANRGQNLRYWVHQRKITSNTESRTIVVDAIVSANGATVVSANNNKVFGFWSMYSILLHIYNNKVFGVWSLYSILLHIYNGEL
jgi:hypothetical protein